MARLSRDTLQSALTTSSGALFPDGFLSPTANLICSDTFMGCDSEIHSTTTSLSRASRALSSYQETCSKSAETAAQVIGGVRVHQQLHAQRSPRRRRR